MDLEARHPLLFREEQAPFLRPTGVLLLPLFNRVQLASGLLDRHRVQIKEGFDGDGHLLEVIGHGVEEFLDFLLLSHLVTESAQLICQCSHAEREVLNALPHLELQVRKLTVQFVSVSLLDVFTTHAHRTDSFPGISGGLHPCEPGLHLLWNGPQQNSQCVSIFTVISGAILDGIPQTRHLQIHPHHQCPFGIVAAGEDKVGYPCDRFLDHPLDDGATP
jgi:hypothetical protein